MSTQGERQEFLWRPNDNSSTTITRYELEAAHWVKAFSSAQAKSQPVTIGESFAVIGLVISFFFSLLNLLIIILVTFFTWAFNLDNNRSRKYESSYDNTYEDEIAYEVEATKSVEPSPISAREKSIRLVLQKRPAVFKTMRHNLFKKAAFMVVMKQKVSISGMMYELNIDFETVSTLIDQLYEAGVISGINDNKGRKVYLRDKEALDLLYHLEEEYATI